MSCGKPKSDKNRGDPKFRVKSYSLKASPGCLRRECEARKGRNMGMFCVYRR